jgi:uncharacterized peroxidase-related enzyme
MSRLRIPTRDGAPDESKPLLDRIYERLGVVPKYARLVSNSPLAMSAYVAFQDGLAKVLDPKMRARIALAVAQANGSHYCVSAHSYIATNFANLPPDEIALNREGSSKDPAAQAVVRFAGKVVRKRGRVTDADIKAVRMAGFDDAQIVEIIALIAQTTFLNYLNEVAKTAIDFPAASETLHTA